MEQEKTWKTHFIKYIKRWGEYAILFFLIALLFPCSDLPPERYFQRRLSDEISGYGFDFFLWEARALALKLGFEFAAPQDTLSPAQRHQLVTDYLDGLRRTHILQDEIKHLYSQYEGSKATAEAAPKEQELLELRSWLRARQNMVEGILEEQVSAALQDEHFGRWGYLWPPVKIRFTELPLLLVVSSRAAITREADVILQAGIPISDRSAMEAGIDNRFSAKRSLVTPIGGLSAYPAMIYETESLIWLSDTFAHEWTHHFLAFRPLGYNYNTSGEMTSINETTASIVGREVGRRLILRFYPELTDRLPALPTPPTCPPMSAGELVWPDEPPPDQFDYNREMRQTRLWVDKLLSQGKVEQAEAYMEMRRKRFVEQGHNIRKLNQAYFAFHGSYATSPSTANPIGGQLEWLRAQHTTLRDYVRTVAAFQNHQDLLKQLEAQPCTP